MTWKYAWNDCYAKYKKTKSVNLLRYWDVRQVTREQWIFKAEWECRNN